MKDRYLIWGGIFLAVILIAGGYYFRQEQKEPEFSDTKDNVTICYLNYLNSGLIIIAQMNGIFSQKGLEVTLKEIPSGRMAMDRMFNGECDIAMTSETPPVASSFIRNDFKIISMISYSDNNNKIIARTDSGIRKPGDLRGKRIATSEGSASFFFLQVFLAKNGILMDDVTLVFMTAEEAPKALEDKKIDAFSQGEPYISRTKKLLGNKTVVFAQSGLNVMTSDLVALNSFIREKPEVIERVLIALIQAEDYSKENPEETFRIFSKQYGIDESDLSAILIDTRLRVALDISLVFSMEDRARWMINNNQTNATIIPNYLDFIYTDGLEKIKPERVSIIH